MSNDVAPRSSDCSTTGARYTTMLSGLLASLDYTRDRFTFNQGSELSGHTTTIGTRFSPHLADGASLEASATLAQTTLDGMTTSESSMRTIHSAARGRFRPG